MIDLRCGDCLEVMRGMDEACVDTIITDPPYGLSFMGKDWDHGVPGIPFWEAALRVAKPGATLLAFGGTRTHHRLICAIEDAGWEIRDTLMWLYGSGFPKSHDISKAIDKAAGAEREVVRRVRWDGKGTGKKLGTFTASGAPDLMRNDTPATPEAAEWDGWGTALKPSHEDIIIAQKPFTPFVYCAKIIQNLSNKEAELCKYIANDAAKSLEPIQVKSNGAKGVSAQENVVIQPEVVAENATEIGAEGVIDWVPGTLELTPEKARIALNTISSWKNTLVACFDQGRMSTTSTDAETTTDWKTLSYCLSQITLEDITQDVYLQSGLSVHAGSAARFFNATVEKLRSTQELSVLAPVLSREVENYQAETEPNLAPAYEPIIVAMKPLDGTYAANALKWGVAGLAIDKARIGTDGGGTHCTRRDENGDCQGHPDRNGTAFGITYHGKNGNTGRWPANVILDEAAAALLDEQTEGRLHSAGKPCGPKFPRGENTNCYGKANLGVATGARFGDDGAASRFFYCAKSSRSERDAGLEGMPEVASRNYRTGNVHNMHGGRVPDKICRNIHPTVKPLALMRYLCTLTATPAGGVVLDPFMGSGSTGIAAKQTGRDFIGIEISPDYYEIARRRIEYAQVDAQLRLEGV